MLLFKWVVIAKLCLDLARLPSLSNVGLNFEPIKMSTIGLPQVDKISKPWPLSMPYNCALFFGSLLLNKKNTWISLTFNPLLTFIREKESTLRRSYDPKSKTYPPKWRAELGMHKVLLLPQLSVTCITSGWV